MFQPIREHFCAIAQRSHKIGQLAGAYPPSISLPLIIEKRTVSWGLPSLYISTSIHRNQVRQLGLSLPLYLYLYSQKIEQVVGAFPLSISLPLFIENRTCSQGLTSIYISNSIHRKQDRQLGLNLHLYLYLYSQKIGQVVWSHPPSISISIFIHTKQKRQLGLTLPLYLYLYSQKLGQVVGAFPPSISLSLFIENRTGSQGLTSIYISTSIHRKQDRQLGLTLPLYLFLYS